MSHQVMINSHQVVVRGQALSVERLKQDARGKLRDAEEPLGGAGSDWTRKHQGKP